MYNATAVCLQCFPIAIAARFHEPIVTCADNSSIYSFDIKYICRGRRSPIDRVTWRVTWHVSKFPSNGTYWSV